MTYDILITGGTILDGTGRPRFPGAVGVSNGSIAEIGSPHLAGATAKKTISADGRYVAPGFVDITSHADANFSLFVNPLQDYLLTQGVSTILAGNCGSSPAPLVGPDAVQSLRKWNEAGVNINWLSTGEYLAELARRALGVNVATLVGHGTIRRGLLAGASRAFIPEELAQFSGVLAQSLREGACGLSLGLAYSHEAPASAAELSALGRIVAEAGGVIKAHIRSESAGIVPAVNEMIQLAREASCRVVISHFKAIGRKSWPRFRQVLEMLNRAEAAGVPIRFDLSPYRRTGSFLYLLLPAWARQGGFEVMMSRLQDPADRKAILGDLDALDLHYDKLVVATSRVPGTNGWTIRELAERSGRPPAETLLDLVLVNRGKVTMFGETLSFRNIELAIQHPSAIIASDGSGILPLSSAEERLIHPRSVGTFPHFLHRFVVEKELLSWEDAIRRITAFPAEAAGLADRGIIAKGRPADVVVFDPRQIRDRATYRNPFVHSVGIDAVLVNGALALERGALTGIAGGRVLKKS